MGENKTGTGNNGTDNSSGTQGNAQSGALGTGSMIGKPEILAHAANPRIKAESIGTFGESGSASEKD